MPQRPLKLPEKLAKKGKTLEDIRKMVFEKKKSTSYVIKQTKADAFKEHAYFQSLVNKIKRINQRLKEKTTNSFTKRMLSFELIRTKMDLNLMEFKVTTEFNLKNIERMPNTSSVVLKKISVLKNMVNKILRDIDFSLEAQTISIENAKKFSSKLSSESQRIDTINDLEKFLNKKLIELQNYKLLN